MEHPTKNARRLGNPLQARAFFRGGQAPGFFVFYTPGSRPAYPAAMPTTAEPTISNMGWTFFQWATRMAASSTAASTHCMTPPRGRRRPPR